MRRLIFAIGIGLLSLSSGCGNPMGIVQGEWVEIQAWGTVKTAQGVPVSGVLAGSLHWPGSGETNTEGQYETSATTIGKTQCDDVAWVFQKGPHRKTVWVGKCGRREVNINDWPEEG